MDYSLYNDFDNIVNARRTVGRHTDIFLDKYKNIKVKDINKILTQNLLRFSFFKTSSLFLHRLIYDHGFYLSISKAADSYSRITVNDYASLYFLPQITKITEENTNTATMLVNNFTHNNHVFLQAPDYILSDNITNFGDGPLANDNWYHFNMATFILLSKWFDYLKQNNVYDNTRIIIAADHGRVNTHLPHPYNMPLPAGYLNAYNILFMVKDFEADKKFKTDYTFMTNADVPHLMASGFIENFIGIHFATYPASRKRINTDTAFT